MAKAVGLCQSPKDCQCMSLWFTRQYPKFMQKVVSENKARYNLRPKVQGWKAYCFWKNWWILRMSFTDNFCRFSVEPEKFDACYWPIRQWSDVDYASDALVLQWGRIGTSKLAPKQEFNHWDWSPCLFLERLTHGDNMLEMPSRKPGSKAELHPYYFFSYLGLSPLCWFIGCTESQLLIG